MVKFEFVNIKNFMSVGDNEITIRLDENESTLVTGENGAGKSVLLVDSTYFALFGKSFRGLNKNDMINKINKKNCLVVVQFRARGKTYRIERGIKPAVLTVFENGEKLADEYSTAQTQKLIEEEIIGFDEKSFRQTQVISTTNFKPFMELSTGERRELIEQLLDIGIFADMKKNLHERNKTVKRDIEDGDREIENIRQRLKTSKDFVDKLEDQANSNVDEYRDQLKEAQAEHKEWEDALEKAVTESDELQDDSERDRGRSECEEQLHANKQVKRELQDNIVRNQQRRKDLKEKIAWFDDHDHCPTCKQSLEGSDIASEIPKFEEEQEQLDAQIARDEDEKNRLAETIDEQQNLIDEWLREDDEVDQHIQECARGRKRAGAQIERIEKLIEKNQTNNDVQIAEERETIFAIEDELKSAEKTNRQARKKYAVMLKAYKMLADDGIKSIIIDNYIPMLNNAVNSYLDALNFNISFTLDREFNETVQSRMRKDMGYKNFSMGQRHRIDLALILAWRKVAQAKNSVYTNLLIFDEMFDSSIDDAGSEDLKAIIDAEHAAGGTQPELNVFVISHRPALKEIFDHNIDFELNKGFTRVRDRV